MAAATTQPEYSYMDYLQLQLRCGRSTDKLMSETVWLGCAPEAQQRILRQCRICLAQAEQQKSSEQLCR